MYCAQFIFKPGTYDEQFHKFDNEIEAFVLTIDGFRGAEHWLSLDGEIKNSMYYFDTMDAVKTLSKYPAHLEAKKLYKNWYDGYQIVVSEVLSIYGDNTIKTIAQTS